MKTERTSDNAPLVAIVEADQAVRELLRNFLNEEGYDIVICANARTAPSIIRQVNADLVLLNLWLEERDDGWQILERLQREATTATLPVIVLTTGAKALGKQHSLDVQPQWQEMSMPFNLDDLLDKISTGLEAKPLLLEDAALAPRIAYSVVKQPPILRAAQREKS